MTSDQLELEIKRHAETAEELRTSQETVRALLDATTETALLVDTDGKILALNTVANERLKRLSSKPVGDGDYELLGHNVFDLFPPELREARKARNDDVIKSGVMARFEDERAGRWMDNRIYPIFDQEGVVTKLAVFSYDITDRMRAEASLHLSGEHLRQELERHERTAESLRETQDTVHALLDATMETALLVDTDGKILALNTVANERLKRLSPKPVGHGAQELLGHNVFDLFSQLQDHSGFSLCSW